MPHWKSVNNDAADAILGVELQPGVYTVKSPTGKMAWDKTRNNAFIYVFGIPLEKEGMSKANAGPVDPSAITPPGPAKQQPVAGSKAVNSALKPSVT